MNHWGNELPKTNCPQYVQQFFKWIKKICSAIICSSKNNNGTVFSVIELVLFGGGSTEKPENIPIIPDPGNTGEGNKKRE